MTTFIKNKMATFNYEILDHYEAGIVLLGSEVKSIKLNQGSLKEAFVIIEDGELFLVKSHIPAFQPNNARPGYDPYQKRKLLLSKKEIAEIMKKKHESGLTLIPISMYSKGNRIKLDMALARGKKKHDKRESIKKRDTERDLGRKLKGG
jgi:SsrA-binding protein